MGEVYRARDTTLDRDVAIKVLPDAFADDPERLARFEREAKLLASLNHPNIAVVYGLVTSSEHATRALVMELIEGETLAERIHRGPLSADEARSLFIQIAEGLGAAHEKGVIHRDLKPANVMSTPEGIVKILDFGLAKALVREGEPALDTSQSPTLTKGTALGVIMGTAHYMSPEQARGKPVDKRTDVWAFGCCLFEALSGRKAFDGEVATDVLGAVIHNEPDWNALPTIAPQRLLERCLRKNRHDRLQDIGDARIELDDQEAERTTQTRSVKPFALMLTLATLAGIAIGAGLLSLFGNDARPLPEPKRFAIPLSEGERIGDYFITSDNPLAFSPDGSHLVYAASLGSTSSLYLRDMSSGKTRQLLGTTGATDPFFSPDVQWVGFFAQSRLQKVRLAGGEPQFITARMNTYASRGASWGPNGSIVFSGRPGLFLVSENGGEPEPLTSGRDDRFPKFLPNGKFILFTAGIEFQEEGRLAILDVASREQTVLEELGHAASGVYLDSGHLAFARGRDLLVTQFDPVERRHQGEPRLVISGLFAAASGRSYFAVSRNGDLSFVLGDPAQRSLVVVDRVGRERHVAQGQYMHPAFIFDGNRLRVLHASALTPGFWEFDTERGTAARSDTVLTSRDGSQRIFNRSGELWLESIESPKSPVLMEGVGFPSSWSSDGQLVAFLPEGSSDVGVARIDGSEPPQIILDSPYKEIWGVFSPDGRYLAYVSDELGRDEVYVVGFPDRSQKWAVTNAECNQPLWWGDEIFFRCADRAMSLEVATDPVFRVVGEPELMFEGPYDRDEIGDSHWDVSPDGQRFAMVRVHEASRPRQIEVILNWFTELERLVPSTN